MMRGIVGKFDFESQKNDCNIFSKTELPEGYATTIPDC